MAWISHAERRDAFAKAERKSFMIYVILANGFEEVEALTPIDVLRRAGYEVTTVGITGKTAMGAHGIPVVCDVLAEDAGELRDAELVVFPGGMPGAENINLFDKTDVYIRSALSNGGFVGAICAAPMVLGKRGYLEGRRAVCFPGFEEYLKGAEIVSGADAVRDGAFVTSRCMGTALSFALELVECLGGRELRDRTERAVKAL